MEHVQIETIDADCLMPPVEALIIRRCIDDLLAAGYTLSVNDGGETTLRQSADARAIFAAMATTDEDYLHVHGAGVAFSWIRFVYGNGADVICDYGTNLEADLAGANAFADLLAG